MSSHELKKAGLKVTLPRVKILEILENAEEHHMSAEDVYRALMQSGTDVGLATVYRVLTQFESAGLVPRHQDLMKVGGKKVGPGQGLRQGRP